MPNFDFSNSDLFNADKTVRNFVSEVEKQVAEECEVHRTLTETEHSIIRFTAIIAFKRAMKLLLVLPFVFNPNAYWQSPPPQNPAVLQQPQPQFQQFTITNPDAATYGVLQCLGNTCTYNQTTPRQEPDFNDWNRR